MNYVGIFRFNLLTRSWSYNMGHGGKKSLWETPVIEAAAERSVLPPEASTSQETREGKSVDHTSARCNKFHTHLTFGSTSKSNHQSQEFVLFGIYSAVQHITHSVYLFSISLQEREQMQHYNQRMIEILKARQQQEKHRLPKIQRSEAKTRLAMFKKSLRINPSGSASEDRDKIKQVRGKRFSTCILKHKVNFSVTHSIFSLQFSLQEEKRQKAERLNQQQKHESQMREMIGQCESNTRELQLLQVTHLLHTSLFCPVCHCMFIC